MTVDPGGEMRLGSDVVMTVDVLTGVITEDLKKNLTKHGSDDPTTMIIGSKVVSSLTGPASEVFIEPIEAPDAYLLTSGERSTWKWRVKPLKYGSITLSLVVKVDVKAMGTEVGKELNTRPLRREIVPNTVDQTRFLIAQNWSTLLPMIPVIFTALGGAIVWVGTRVFSRSKSIRARKNAAEAFGIVKALVHDTGQIERLRYDVHGSKVDICLFALPTKLALALPRKLICRIRFGDNKTYYEHHYNHEHHDHMICTECGKVIEFFSADIETLQEQMANNFGFRPTHHSLRLWGICAECQRETGDSHTAPSGAQPRVRVKTAMH